MFVTTIICTYNYSQWLDEAIDSVLKQDYDHSKMGLVVIDDCSTDRTFEILQAKLAKSNIQQQNNCLILSGFLAGIECVFIRLDKNMGPSEARNIAIQVALQKTDAFLILDSDDVAYPNKITRMVEVMSEYPQDIGVVYADYDILDMDTGNTIREFKEPFCLFRLQSECIVHSGSLISKAALVKVLNKDGFYNKTMRCVEDFELWRRISAHYMINHIAEPLTLVRNHSNNSTHTVPKQVWEQNWMKLRDV